MDLTTMFAGLDAESLLVKRKAEDDTKFLNYISGLYAGN